MAAITKLFTDIPQSKKLVNILPLESADMWYSYYGNPKYNPTITYEGEQWFLCQIVNSWHTDIPCWSLSTLIDILPLEIDISKVDADTENERYMCTVGINGDIISTFADNPIDVCVEMIIRLNELNVLKI